MRIITTISLIFYFLLPVISSAQRTILYPYVEVNSDPESTIIKSIELTSEYTKVIVEYEVGHNVSWYRTANPGSKKAFYISNESGKRISELTGMKNISPKKKRVSWFDEIEFALYFQPIDKKIQKIDIVEGSTRNGWNFYGVNLGSYNNKPENTNEKIEPEQETLVSSGTGFFISTEGYIATNFHVIDGSSELQVIFPLENEFVTYEAMVFLKDKTNDIAILKIKDKNFKKLNNLPYDLSDEYQVGDEVFTIGYPQPEIMGTESKLTKGIINSLTGIDNDYTCVQISVQVQPGNSGGPLFNSEGNIVGITTSSLNAIFMAKYKGNIPQNVNYAVKTDYLKVLTKNIHLDGNNIVKDMTFKEKVKTIKPFVCLIKVY